MLSQMGVAGHQLEVIVCCLGLPSKSDSDITCGVLAGRHTCDRAFLKSFGQVSRILSSRWACPFYKMGDVHTISHAYYRLLRHSQSAMHPLPSWLLGGFFFVVHRLRFSDLHVCFVQQIIAEDAIWQEQAESEREGTLRRVMPKVMAEISSLWSAIGCTECPDPRFIIERQLVPNRVLQSLGGYANGPTSWSWLSFPFKQIGAPSSRYQFGGCIICTAHACVCRMRIYQMRAYAETYARRMHFEQDDYILYQ